MAEIVVRVVVGVVVEVVVRVVVEEDVAMRVVLGGPEIEAHVIVR